MTEPSQSSPAPESSHDQHSPNKQKSSSNSATNSASPTTSKKPGLFGVIQSVLAAMFGVQSESKRQQDFENGSAAEYIFVGIIAVTLFVLGIIWYVNSAIADYQAGP
ncbi:DUF2970 domain-containing protein [Pleionea litopenaei]|uniref:DUF2970 domain-containing protein n=1 Tax=Pleionea litopenaei TaxID=3070815 RepID=A0AA51RS52_9GAMM|nr:DUF2970 domain-containing protein [Pleionea sp. HL-JVS1]WMS86643.1 DUF2970 domain-containing protein [Pleionea sp. HL-JVS1]